MASKSRSQSKFQPGGHAQLALSKRGPSHKTRDGSDREGSIISSSVVSQTTGPVPQREVRLENTYRTEPNVKFIPAKAQAIMLEVMRVFLEDKRYEADSCASTARNLSSLLTQRAKELGVPRYKYVCSVVMGEKKKQDVHSGSRCLWSTHTDSFATATYNNGDLFATATLFGVYLE